jgi:hypothetical protein
MPPRPWWTEVEVELLIALHERSGPDPPDDEVERLRKQLLELRPEYREDPSYRSAGAIRSQLEWIHLLAENDPRGQAAPRRFRRAWARYRLDLPLTPQPNTVGGGAAEDRRELIGVLQRLRVTLAELVGSSYLPQTLRSSSAAAWAELERRGYIEQAIASLSGPAVDDLLSVHGLLGEQRTAKTDAVEEAVRERRRHPGWRPLKALLGYLDSILGSLTGIFPWLAPVKEFKEITETSAELASGADGGSR